MESKQGHNFSILVYNPVALNNVFFFLIEFYHGSNKKSFKNNKSSYFDGIIEISINLSNFFKTQKRNFNSHFSNEVVTLKTDEYFT